MPSFTARIEQNWIMRCVIVPAKVMKALGGGVRIPVVAEYCGEKLLTTVMPAGGGRGRLLVLAQVVRAAKLDFGDKVDVTLTRSHDPREPVVPPDLRRALQFRPAAREAFEQGPASQRRWVVQYVEDSRRPETRVAHIERVCDNLAARTERRQRKAEGKRSTPNERLTFKCVRSDRTSFPWKMIGLRQIT